MKISVFSLKKVIPEIKAGTNLISIRDQGVLYDDAFKYAEIDRIGAEVGAKILPITFDDVDPYRFKHGMENPFVYKRIESCGGVPIYFNEEIARKIVDWATKLWLENPDVEIKIHCWAGRSRSQAIAYWLNTYFNLIQGHDIDQYYENNAQNVWEKIHFNCEVLKVFTMVYG